MHASSPFPAISCPWQLHLNFLCQAESNGRFSAIRLIVRISGPGQEPPFPTPSGWSFKGPFDSETCRTVDGRASAEVNLHYITVAPLKAQPGTSLFQTHCSRERVRGQSLAFGQGTCNPTKGLRTRRRNTNQAAALLEIVNTERRGKTGTARGRQNMVRAGAIIAQRF